MSKLKSRQALTMEQKLLLSKSRITKWNLYYSGQVVIKFEDTDPGKVLLHMVNKMYPDIAVVMAGGDIPYKYPYTAVMALDDPAMIADYQRFGCNKCNSSPKQSRPLMFWLDADIKEYIKKYKLG